MELTETCKTNIHLSLSATCTACTRIFPIYSRTLQDANKNFIVITSLTSLMLHDLYYLQSKYGTKCVILKYIFYESILKVVQLPYSALKASRLQKKNTVRIPELYSPTMYGWTILTTIKLSLIQFNYKFH